MVCPPCHADLHELLNPDAHWCVLAMDVGIGPGSSISGDTHVYSRDLQHLHVPCLLDRSPSSNQTDAELHIGR